MMELNMNVPKINPPPFAWYSQKPVNIYRVIKSKYTLNMHGYVLHVPPPPSFKVMFQKCVDQVRALAQTRFDLTGPILSILSKYNLNRCISLLLTGHWKILCLCMYRDIQLNCNYIYQISGRPRVNLNSENNYISIQI